MTSVPCRIRHSTKTSAPVSVRVGVETGWLEIVDTIRVPQNKRLDRKTSRPRETAKRRLKLAISLYTQKYRFESSFKVRSNSPLRKVSVIVSAGMRLRHKSFDNWLLCRVLSESTPSAAAHQTTATECESSERRSCKLLMHISLHPSLLV